MNVTMINAVLFFSMVSSFTSMQYCYRFLMFARHESGTRKTFIWLMTKITMKIIRLLYSTQNDMIVGLNIQNWCVDGKYRIYFARLRNWWKTNFSKSFHPFLTKQKFSNKIMLFYLIIKKDNGHLVDTSSVCVVMHTCATQPLFNKVHTKWNRSLLIYEVFTERTLLIGN